MACSTACAAAVTTSRRQTNSGPGAWDALQRAGRSPYLTGLDAQRTLAAAESALAVSDDQIAADQVKLFLALGEGWRNAPPVQRTPAPTR